MDIKYYCQDCKTSFVRKYLYTIHLNSRKHALRTSNKESLFSCICGKTYKYKKSLEYHRKTTICFPVSNLNNDVYIE